MRKFCSLSTLGVVPYRSDREVIVHVARKRAERGERRARYADRDQRMARADDMLVRMRADNIARKTAKAAARAAAVTPDPVTPDPVTPTR